MRIPYSIFWRIVYGLGINWLYEHASKKKLTLLGYHSISHPHDIGNLYGELYGHLSVPVWLFENELKTLVKKGYRFMRLRELVLVSQGQKELPDKAIVIYFDDGYRDNFLNAYPVLRRLGIPAVVFPVVDFVERRAHPWETSLEPKDLDMYLTWEDMNKMKDVFEFGTHTMSHAKLVSLSLEEVRREIEESRRIIEEKIGEKVLALSYPKSRWNEDVRQVAKGAGFEFILSHDRDFNYGPDYRFLNKIPIGPDDSLLMFKLKLGIYYPLINFFRALKKNLKPKT